MGQDRTSIHERIAGALDIAALAGWLDGLQQDERVRDVRSLGKQEQASLFDAAKGVRPIGLDDVVRFVPPVAQDVPLVLQALTDPSLQ